MSPEEILLDVHDLPAPEPMEQALDALDRLCEGRYIKMIHRMQPFPLYRILDENGFRYKVISTNGGFEIYIWLSDDTIADQLPI
jgi:hypothetical protein